MRKLGKKIKYPQPWGRRGRIRDARGKKVVALNEKALVAACQRGERQAFDELISTYYPYVSHFLLRMKKSNRTFIAQGAAADLRKHKPCPLPGRMLVLNGTSNAMSCFDAMINARPTILIIANNFIRGERICSARIHCDNGCLAIYPGYTCGHLANEATLRCILEFIQAVFRYDHERRGRNAVAVVAANQHSRDVWSNEADKSDDPREGNGSRGKDGREKKCEHENSLIVDAESGGLLVAKRHVHKLFFLMV